MRVGADPALALRAEPLSAQGLVGSRFDPGEGGRYMLVVQHSSDRKRDGVWYVIERTDDLKYARERACVFAASYGPRPVAIFDEELA